jgi:murein DD-endopeptidase MepM/ murein hydrolase activator NlpD
MQLSINLPKMRRLDLQLVKKRKDAKNTPLFPDLGKIRRMRSGNKISRFFRHIFEHNKIQKLLGTNLAVLAIASSLFPTNHPFSEEIQESAITQAPTVFKTEIALQYPVESVKVTQGYRFYHPGIDLDGLTGDSIRPIMSGKIEGLQYSKTGYGNAVLVSHNEGIMSFYAHLSKIFVGKDQEVTTSTILGQMGTSGRAYGDHLHLEIFQNGKSINPSTFLSF